MQVTVTSLVAYESNQVFAFEADGSQDEFIVDNLIKITESETDVLRHPKNIFMKLLYEAQVLMVMTKAMAYRSAIESDGVLVDGN